MIGRDLACLTTTSLIMLMVLVPIIALISIATSQFTAMVSQVDFDDLSEALDRGREQLGISLQHPEQFRRLDTLADSLDEAENPDSPVAPNQISRNIDEALMLIRFLQDEEQGRASADLAAANAEDRLESLKKSVQQHLKSDLRLRKRRCNRQHQCGGAVPSSKRDRFGRDSNLDARISRRNLSQSGSAVCQPQRGRF